MKIGFTILPCLLLLHLSAGYSAMRTPVPTAHDDGPYVHYTKDMIHMRRIVTVNGAASLKHDSIRMSDKAGLVLTVNTDLPGKTFTVRLKARLENEKPEYRKASRQLVISDIEGNFGAFRKLLLSAGVIDDRFEWTFGDGHLILCGDFFDRGDQVTELLWLCYSLEEKAIRAGGHVHFILGNHEIMNLSLDLRYVHPRYLEHAALMQLGYNAFYDTGSELGRWLRTKNVAEKIGRNLYAHGGISRLVNLVDWDLPAMNAMARPFYADTAFIYPDVRTELIFSDQGPFWFRGYYTGDTTGMAAIIDTTCLKFGVERVVTGHTPVADTVSSWYGGKLINVDTPHRLGKSEALLLEGGRIYRIDGSGKKILFRG